MRSVRTYRELSSKFANSSGVHQGLPLYPLTSNFVIDMLLQITLPSCDFSEIDLLPRDSLVHLEYTDNVVLFDQNLEQMQSIMITKMYNTSMLEMQSSPSKYKISLQDWLALMLELMIDSKVVEHINHFTYLWSLISLDVLVADENSIWI